MRVFKYILNSDKVLILPAKLSLNEYAYITPHEIGIKEYLDAIPKEFKEQNISLVLYNDLQTAFANLSNAEVFTYYTTLYTIPGKAKLYLKEWPEESQQVYYKGKSLLLNEVGVTKGIGQVYVTQPAKNSSGPSPLMNFDFEFYMGPSSKAIDEYK